VRVFLEASQRWQQFLLELGGKGVRLDDAIELVDFEIQAFLIRFQESLVTDSHIGLRPQKLLEQ
jgi:hypothetical protein